MVMGRPTDYTPELADKICALIATHPISIKRICAKYPELPAQDTIFQWITRHDYFAGQYLVAKESQALCVADELWDEVSNDLDSDELALFDRRFRFQQWHLSKLAPKQFGNKQEIKNETTLHVHEDSLGHLK